MIMVLGTSEDDRQRSDTFRWGQKLASGSEEMVTLTKTQLQALLNALGEQEKSSIVSHLKLNGPPRHEAKISPPEDDHLPSWVRRNSVACPASPGSLATSETSQLEELQRSQLSSSHPELGSNAPVRPFSKVAQKQLQWQRERAEMQDWHPWGRPGAGAPRRQPVAAVPPRTEMQVLRVQGTASTVGAYTSRAPTPPAIPQPLLPSHASPAFVRRVPPALRSSIPFGPTSDPQEEEKDEVRRRWIQDLERQKEEQQRRRMMDQQRFSVSNASWWGDNESTVGSTDTAQRGDDFSDSSAFVRGRGTSQGGPCMDERRQKALEYQRAIQAQVEEKKRREHEEREMRLREEREEERRLEVERRQLAQQYELEQRRQREKAEQEEKKRQVLIAKMQEAQAEAEAARKARRGQKFLHLQQQRPQEEPEREQHGVQEAPAPSTVSASPVTADSGVGSSDNSTKPLPSPQATTATVHPMQNSCGHSSSSSQPPSDCLSAALRETSSQTERGLSSDSASFVQSPQAPRDCHERAKYEPYVENRVLTPTKLRIAQRSLGRLVVHPTGREFGTQTDISLPCGWGAAVENATSSAASSAQSASPQQKTCRVQHSRPTRAARNPSGGETSAPPEHPTGSRPRWGANNPDRVFVKMTDRDPNYHRRKKLQEMRKQHWEREMATRRPLREAVRRTTRLPSHVSRDSSGCWERGRSSSRSPSRSFPSAQTQRTLSNEELNSRADSTEETVENERTFVIRRTSSPPVPALRKTMLQGGDPVLLSPSRAQWTLSKTSPSPEREQPPESPPARKQWQDQKVYVPPSSASPPLPDAWQRNGSEEGPERGRAAQRESSERHRSVSVHGCRPPNPSPSPDRCLQPPRSSSQDPLVHPEVITGRPTPRQDKILQQLSSLRQGLLLRQREMESILRKSKT